MQMAKEIGVTQKTAWFMLGRLREACGGETERLSGIVEVDEAFVGGRERNKHSVKKLRAGRGTVGKQPVIGLRERGGKSVAKPIESTDQATLHAEIAEHVEPGSKVYTDEHRGYDNLRGYEHGHVNHSAGEYVGANDIHTNNVESMWALLKRGLYGTWHHASRKHLGWYVNEVTFRLNEATVRVHTLQRLSAFVSRSFKHRISYEELTS